MIFPFTTSVARMVVDTLHAEGIKLTPKNDYIPVGIRAAIYDVPVTPSHSQLDDGLRHKIVEAFRDANATQGEIETQEFDTLVENMAYGITRMLNVVRNVITPACKKYVEMYELSMKEKMVPNISVTPFVYNPIHHETTLTSHVGSNYNNITARDSYRSFILPFPGMAAIVDWISHNNHIDEATTREWAMTLTEDQYRTIWYTLFGDYRELTADRLYSFVRDKNPNALDQILAAYLLTASLIDEPQDPVGESVALKEWQLTLENLHIVLGSSLNQAYIRRADNVKKKRLILDAHVVTEGQVNISVTVNGDIWGEWLNEGGDIRAVLGAASTDSKITMVDDINNSKDALVDVWNRKHYIYKQTTNEYNNRRRREYITDIICGSYAIDDDGAESLPEVAKETKQARAKIALEGAKEKDYDDYQRLIARLVCHVYYPETPYLEFLETMDRVAQDLPDLNPREVSLITTVELVALWLANQIDAYTITYSVKENKEVSQVNVEA